MLAVVAMVAFAATPLVGGAQAAVAPIGPDPMENLVEPGAAVTLSDETKITRWAHATETEPVRVAASNSAPDDHEACATRPRTRSPRSTSCSRPRSTPPAISGCTSACR